MRTTILLTMALLLVACSATPRNPYVFAPNAPVWPAPPETSRVQYVTSIHRHSDLFETGGFLDRAIRLVAGDEDSSLVRPYAVALHPDGGLLVTDPGVMVVHFYDTARRRYRAIGRDLDGGLTSPVGVAVASDGSILVSDSRRRTIERFDRNGRHLGPFASEEIFQRPGGIAVDQRSGTVFAADVLAHTILVLSPEGTLLGTFGGNGAEPGQFNFPTHIALDPQGNLLVADSMNFRIQHLTQTGEVIGTFGEAGNARGDFARPKGVAAIDQDVFVAVEGLYDSLVFFAPTGELLLNVGEAGSAPGQFWLPAGLAMDRSRNLLFVADSYNSRVQVFRMMTPNGGEATP